MNQLSPVNPTERRTVEAVQRTSAQVIGAALGELRKADEIRAIENQVITLMGQELSDHRGGSEVHSILAAALANLTEAERLTRNRGETNGG